MHVFMLNGMKEREKKGKRGTEKEKSTASRQGGQSIGLCSIFSSQGILFF